MDLPQKFLATAIGSFPHQDPDSALEMIFNACPEAPVWPQLPKTHLNEQMEIQYSEGLPCIKIDYDKERMFFDTTGDYSEEFASFYENYLTAMEGDPADVDWSSIGISPDFSKGIVAFEERLKTSGEKLPFVKVHTTGPVSFALTVVDETKRAIYYNEEFRDVVVKAMALKCRWQIQKFKPYAEKVICFVDEPILSAFGSSTYISVTREEVVGILSEMVEAIHLDGAIAGVHCCGNTDWSILIEAGVDLVNFDAFQYGETIALYPEAVKKFLQGGGLLAWGVVPTSDDINDQTVDSLMEQYNKGVAHLSQEAGIDRELIHKTSIITPSCGTGSMPLETAQKVFAALKGLSTKLRETY